MHLSGLKLDPDLTLPRMCTGRGAQILEAFRKTAGWQKLCEGTKGLGRKVWTWTKILSFLGSKTLFLGQEVH